MVNAFHRIEIREFLSSCSLKVENMSYPKAKISGTLPALLELRIPSVSQLCHLMQGRDLLIDPNADFYLQIGDLGVIGRIHHLNAGMFHFKLMDLSKNLSSSMGCS